MGLFETGSTLCVDPKPEGGVHIRPVGHMELTYICDGDGCSRGELRDGMWLATVVLARDGAVVDDSEVDGWTFFYDEPGGPCTRSYCPSCERTREAGR